ncbi:hypothetical protein QAD02_023275 [Eretmocerus hayati]|uniref:Uncharacterized protein n=1 Tax=Eretmocerus hayati TaxID=131215 RepID=A0ACC2PX07_9HYME|nr:hypothetical protein QAD02_023275 [Eretmocerus hayati]
MSALVNLATSAPQITPVVLAAPNTQQLTQQALLARQQQQALVASQQQQTAAALLAQVPQRQGIPDARGVFVTREEPSDNIGLDGYRFSYELSDGQTREETAQVERRSPVLEDAVLRVRGSYSWVDPVSGQQFSVSYIADENGFQPQATHLPVSGRTQIATAAAVAPVVPVVPVAAVLRP